ncbi:M61 family metallopeptidase [Hymenobacter psychrotolerans]|uniref:Predicted metalloprotease, contains C-terminal PDZ domain n=1 Tax=Hymenobacter psychrotolerans DSM 18569 TaxID=1121959 RepID=A0A1M6PLF1_9BACT|nr:peptidase [Hymenobacter psychrotolerans]SHK08703.1 Predicted metalloprotease, contains C-terminal PDZ domain [Hymenobacter psychrotolerans DSM 18569]
MKLLSRLAALAALLTVPLAAALAQAPLTYTISMDPAANSNEFQVKLELPALSKEQGVYQFAATAPGTYQVMDIGRFVRTFEAFDKKGKPLAVKQLSTNQWQLLKPEKTREIRYTIAETWDTPVKEHAVYRMCGSSLETDHALLNGQTILGYPQGWQARPLRIKLNYPQNWKIGTALTADAQGYYTANTYDHAVDSPFLLGRLTQAKTMLGTTEVDLFCYSKTDQVQAEPLLKEMQQMLNAAQQFLVQLPVQRYTFLYHFDDVSNGAWEHSYSSEYVLREEPLTPESAAGITSIAAHEFFHVVTPLNIHSEVIQQFNFVQPTGSEHLWLYEGTTEWAAGMMQLRGGLMPLEKYLQEMSSKIAYDHLYADTTYSLSRLGLNSFSDEGQRQYGNIYQRGALTAALLDLRLLELSGGKRGLREVILDLTKRYGPTKPFAEKTFFQDFTQLTYPEIGDFFARYVQQAQPLPLTDYYAKVGVQYSPVLRTGRQLASLGTSFKSDENGIVFEQVGPELKACGVADGDQLVAYQGEAVTREGMRAFLAKTKASQPGQAYTLTIRRAGQEKQVKCKLLGNEEVKRYQLTALPNPTPAQLALRQAWLKNL